MNVAKRMELFGVKRSRLRDPKKLEKSQHGSFDIFIESAPMEIKSPNDLIILCFAEFDDCRESSHIYHFTSQVNHQQGKFIKGWYLSL